MRFALLAATLPVLGAFAHGTRDPAETRPAEPPRGSVAGRVTIVDRDGPRPGEASVVYIQRADPALWREVAPGRRARGSAVLTMKSKRFSPRVAAVVAGEEVDFPNLDPVFHNVFSRSGKNSFDLGLYKDGARKSRTFKEPGVVRVYCNIHPAMTAYVLVLQNPWHAAAGADGSFRIEGVAPGEYVLVAWDEKGGETTRPVVVAPGAVARADLELDARAWKELPHKNKHGKEYGKGDAY